MKQIAYFLSIAFVLTSFSCVATDPMDIDMQDASVRDMEIDRAPATAPAATRYHRHTRRRVNHIVRAWAQARRHGSVSHNMVIG